MDRKLESSGRDKVRRELAGRLRPAGFVHTKPSFLVRTAPRVLEFVHTHKFSFGPSFRLHAGIRVLGDPFEAIALNGPDSAGHTLSILKKQDEKWVLARDANMLAPVPNK